MIPRTAIPIGNEELLQVLFPMLRSDIDEIIAFEKEFANFLGVKKVFLVNSGRTALYLALRALGLETGQKVIVPAYACPIIFEVVLRLGLEPTLVDIDPETYNINPELITKAITSKTRAIIPIHLFGNPCDMDQIMETASKYGLFVIEDAAQALGAEFNGLRIGTFGDIAIFSFGPGKSITSGEGGAIAINNLELVDRVDKLRQDLPTPDLDWNLRVIKNVIAMKVFSSYHSYALIRNYLERKLDRTDLEILLNCIRLKDKAKNIYPTMKLAKIPSFCARILRIQLKKIDELNQRRRSNALILTELLGRIEDRVQLPKVKGQAKHTFTRYPVRLREYSADVLKKGLVKEGIDVERPYHYLSKYIYHFIDGRYPHMEDVCRDIIVLPAHPCLTIKELHRIAITFVKVLVARSTHHQWNGN